MCFVQVGDFSKKKSSKNKSNSKDTLKSVIKDSGIANVLKKLSYIQSALR